MRACVHASLLFRGKVVTWGTTRGITVCLGDKGGKVSKDRQAPCRNALTQISHVPGSQAS